jgi:hypothetical protein
MPSGALHIQSPKAAPGRPAKKQPAPNAIIRIDAAIDLPCREPASNGFTVYAPAVLLAK